MIIGAGDIGMPIVHYLSERGHILTVIEKDETRCKHIADHADAAIFKGNGDDEEIWRNVEADKMDALMALTNDDETNMAACRIAKKSFGIPFVIARAHQPEYVEKMKEAGADFALCPSLETRRLFLNAIESRTAETLYEMQKADFKLVLATIPQNGSIIGKTLDQINLSEKCEIPAVFRNGTFVFPAESFMFKGGDKALVLGSSENVEKIVEKLRNVEIT
jgi:trk system potassium uptake protein TrkA